jgi:hypothetical protein
VIYDGSGGGVVVSHNALVYIAKSSFKARSATYGGCINNYGGSLTVASSLFTHCPARITCGGILVQNNASLTVVSCLFDGCKSNLVGGLPYTENRENNQSAFRLPSG